MAPAGEDSFLELRKAISEENKAVREIVALFSGEIRGEQDASTVQRRVNGLAQKLEKANNSIPGILSKISISKSLSPRPLVKSSNLAGSKPEGKMKNIITNIFSRDKARMKGESLLEKDVIRRLKKGKKGKKVKSGKPNFYVNISNRFFSRISSKWSKKKVFVSLKKDLVKANMPLLTTSYISIMLFSVLLSFVFSILLFIFLMFFSVGVQLPIITIYTGSILVRLAQTFWIIFTVPIILFLFMYFYPSAERKSIEGKINQELPFVTIHMSAIAGSMVEPSKIFQIIVETGEYPHIQKEFIKLMNEINVYGYDLVTALRSSAQITPSVKLGELFNSLATTITSGGSLNNFFDKRADSLLFEYRLEREKYTRLAETFMDIYISVVIAAPMVLMLLLVLIKVSGLGLNISNSLITFAMIAGVTLINIVFLVFLNFKQPSK